MKKVSSSDELDETFLYSYTAEKYMLIFYLRHVTLTVYEKYISTFRQQRSRQKLPFMTIWYEIGGYSSNTSILK